MTTDTEKLDRILSLVEELHGQGARAQTTAPAAAVPAWQHPPITAEQAVIDGKTINVDGSRWEVNLQGQPERVIHGYFSAEKAPDLHAKLLALFGPSYQEWYDARDEWAIYKVDISEMVERGAVNWLTFSWNMKPYTRFVQ